MIAHDAPAPGDRARAARALVALVALVLIAAVAPFVASPATAQSPYPDRHGLIANGSSMSLSEARLEAEFLDRIGDPYGLDGLVLLVEDCAPEAESYLDGALVHYGLADAPGVLNSDAVVWFVCEDPRYVGFFWGADNAYADRLDDEAVADAMVADLRDANYTGAVADGIEVVAESLAADLDVTDSETSASDPASGAPSRSNRARDALLVAVAGAGGWWWWRRRRAGARAGGKGAHGDGREAAEDATAAMRPREAVDYRLKELRARLIPDDPNVGRLILLYEPLGDEAMLAISKRHEDFLERLDALQASVAQIPVRAASAPAAVGGSGALESMGQQGTKPGAVPADPTSTGGVDGGPAAPRPDAGAESQATAEARADALYREALAEANAILAYVDGLPAEADHAEMLIERAAVLAVEARKAIERAAVEYAAAAATAAAELPPADGIMAFPTRLADRAEAALSAGDRLRAGELAEDAAAAARTIVRAADEFRGVAASIEAAEIAFDRVDEFAESSWADIAGNGSEAEESLDAARDMFRRVMEADPTAFGQDEAAGFEASLRLVFEELARARALADAIGLRLDRILEARETASAMLASIAQEVDDARAWLARPDVDRDVDPSPQAQLGQAEAQLEIGRAAMGVSRPDWIAIRRALHEADRLVDTAVGNARDQQARMEALRRQVGTARQEAAQALEKVDKYVEAHRRDVGVLATDVLRDAREASRRADAAGDDDRGLEDAALAAAIEAQAEGWRRVRDLADRAYSAAAEDVREAESRRQAYVPRPTWIGPTVPIPRVRRGWPMPFDFGGSGGPGPIIMPSGRSHAPRRSSWGSRPSGGGRPTSGRRGGGRGW